MKKIFSEIKKGNLKLLDLQVISKHNLRVIASYINKDPKKYKITIRQTLKTSL